MPVKKRNDGIQRFGPHIVLFEQDLMIRTVYDVRCFPLTRVARRGANLTELVMRSVIYDALLFCLQDKNRRGDSSGSC